MNSNNKVIIAFIANLLLVIAAIALVIFASLNDGNKKKDYDMSGVVFEDLTVEYDGKPHSIFATGLPEGVTASYENNDQTEIGTYEVTAHFEGDITRYNPIPDKTATLTITQPAKGKILSAVGFEIDETGEPPRIYCDVPNTTKQIDLSDKITVTPNRTWKLYQDYDGKEELASKSMSLEIGHNIAYIIITDILNNTSEYEVDVYRLDIKSYTFMNEGEIHASGSIEEKSQLASPENPEKPYYTFKGWAVEGSRDIVQFPYTVTEDITFVAQYAPTNYVITYYLHGGTNDARNPAYYTIESSDIELYPATRDGYVFDGWYSDGEFGTQVTVIQSGSFGAKSLYAKWEYGSGGLIYEQIGNEYKVVGYNGTEREIIVPEEWKNLPVTAIDKGVFENCTNLENIILPQSITGINDYAFRGCTNLKSISFGNNSQLTHIGELVFNGCTSLESIEIPASVTHIGGSAFYNCLRLSAVYITNISGWCNIDFVNNGSTPLYYAHNLYLNYELVTTLEIPAGVTSINYFAFAGCTSLTSIEFPASINSIRFYAFSGCTNLTSVIFSKDSTLTTIESVAFYECKSLNSITIPNSVTEIGFGAFKGCTGLEKITLPFVGATKDGDTNMHFGYIFGADSYNENSTCVPSSLKTVTITGGITIDRYAFYDCANIQSIIIPDSVTEIGSGAFYNCTRLKSIEIPENVSNIMDETFYNCIRLESVEFGENSKLYNIGTYAFYNCVWLKDITIPSGVNTINECAFQNCKSLDRVTFGEKSQLTYINFGTFQNCKSLKSISIPENVLGIGENAFYNCTSLNSITIPDSVTEIGFGAFKGCTGLEKITLPFVGTTKDGDTNTHYGYIFGADSYNENPTCVSSSLKTVTITGGTFIDKYAFWYCVSLTSITLPDSVKRIGTYAFNHCENLDSITIPDKVTSISYGAFQSCESLKSVIFGEQSKLTSIEADVFRCCTNLTSITIPDSVTYIGGHAFAYCENLKSVAIPDKVTSIRDGMFMSCKSLKSVTFGEQSKLTTIGSYAFLFCTNFTSITIPDCVTEIGSSAFQNCESLINITIPDEVKSIGDSSFYECKSLLSIVIPASVTAIGISAFYECANLASVTFREKIQFTSISASMFYRCTSLKSIEIPDSVTAIGVAAFGVCTSLTSIIIPDSVTEIGSFAFEDCTALTSVYITDMAKWCNINFDYYTGNPLYYAQNLYLNNKLVTVLEIPDSVTSIGTYAFAFYEKLTSVTFGKSSQLMSIGSDAFYRCESLSNIEIPATVTAIGASAFSLCIGLIGVTFGENSKLTAISDYAFLECKKLKSIDIPDSVISIGREAFYRCESLTSITIPAGVTSIGYGAFYNCTNLTRVIFKNTSGWTAGDTSISSSSLSNSSTAARYLKETYLNYTWTRTEEE